MSLNDIKLRESQHCFFSNGFVFCNFIVRKNGTVVRPKSSNFLKFYAGGRTRKKTKNRIEEIEKAEVIKKVE